MNREIYENLELLREQIESILEDVEKEGENNCNVQINVKSNSYDGIDKEALSQMLDEVLKNHPKFRLNSVYMKL